MTCSYQPYKMFYAVQAYTGIMNAAGGTGLRTYLNDFSPGMPAFLQVASQSVEPRR